MAYTLETLAPGTPVIVSGLVVGDVRAVYASEGSRQAALLVVRWLSRGEDVALAASEVSTVDAAGVALMAADASSYDDLPVFDAARYPTVHPLS